MRNSRITVIGLASIALLATFATIANAAVLRGKSSDKDPVALFIGSDEELNRFSIRRWKATDCEVSERANFVGTTRTEAPVDRSRPGFFKDKGSYELEDGNLTYRVTAQMKGRQKSKTKWTGIFDADVEILERGERLDECHLNRVSWTARA